MRMLVVVEDVGPPEKHPNDPLKRFGQVLGALLRAHGLRAVTGVYEVPESLADNLLRARLAALVSAEGAEKS